MPVGFRIASAWVDIRAEDKGLRADIKSAVEAATKGQKGKVELNILTRGLRKEVQTALNNATKGMKPKIQIGIASKGLRAEVTAALKRATDKQKPKVKLGISTIGLRGEVQRALTAATKGQKGTVKVKVDVDTDPLKQALADNDDHKIQARVDAQLLRQSLMSAIRRIHAVGDDEININTNIDGDLLQRQITSEVNRLRDRFRVPVTPDVDTNTFAAAIRRAARSVQSDIDIDLNPRINQLKLRAEAGRVFAALRGKINFDGDLHTAMLEAQVARAVARLNAMPHNLVFRTKVDVDRAQAQAAIKRMQALWTNSTHHLTRLTKIVLASVLLIPPALAVVDNALRAIGPASAVTVAGLVAVTTVGATMAVGMNNVVNAIVNSSISLDKYYGFLEQLTPAAKAFVEAVVNQKGAFRDFQATIQETLFADLAKEIRAMADETIPTFTVGLGGMALVLNDMAKGAMNTTTKLAKMGDLDRMFGGLYLAMKPLIPVPGQILNGMVKLATASMPLFTRMNTAMGRWFDNMTGKLNKAFNDGRLQAAITKSGDSIVNFFRRIANNPEFEQFMSHMKATGPEMSEAFRNLSEALLKIINNLSPVAGAIIKVANAFAELVIALPDQFVKIILSIVAAFTLFGLASKGVLRAFGAVTKLRGAMAALATQEAMAALIGQRLHAVGASAPAINRTATAVGRLVRAGLLLGGIALIAWGVNKAMNSIMGRGPVQMDKFTKSLKTFGETGKLSGEAARLFGASWSQQIDGADKKMGGLSEAIKGIAHASAWDKTFNAFQKATNWLDPGKTNLEQYKEKLSSIDKVLSKMVKDGDIDGARRLFGKLSQAAHEGGTSTEKFATLLPQYTKKLKDAKEAQKAAAETMGVFGQAAVDTADRIKTLSAEAQGLTKSLFEMNAVNRDSIGAARDWEASADALDKFIKKNKKKSVDLDYQNGILSQSNDLQREAAQLLEDHAVNTEKSALATFTATGNWDKANKTLSEGRKKLIDSAEAFGLSTDEAKAYADAVMKIPSEKEILLLVKGQAEEQLRKVAGEFRAQPTKKEITVSVLSGPAIQVLRSLGYKVKELPDGQFQVTADTVPAETHLQDLENYKVNDKIVKILAEITKYTLDLAEAQDDLDDLKQKRKVAVGADKKELDAKIEKAQKKVDSLKQKQKAKIEALDKTQEGVDKANETLDTVKDRKVTITVSGFIDQSAKDAAAAIREQAENIRNGGGKKKKWTGGVIRKFAGGGLTGPIAGPGGPTSDRIPAMLSNGEFVMRASAVRKYGMGAMNAINQGRWPGFASGGAVTGSGGGSGAPAVATGVTTGTFTVKDGTGKPVASAVQNFKALKTALNQTYSEMGQKTSQFNNQFEMGTNTTYKAMTTAGTQFGRQQVSRTQTTRTQTLGAWNQWKTGMTSRTSSTYKALGTQAGAFQRTATTRTTQTKTSTQGVWNSWGKGMESRTNTTYQRINSATSSFSKQSTSKIGGARDGMGAAWAGLSPKFKPPVSYLVHTVINKGVVGSMNAIMQKLGGGKTVGGISVPGFATGGPIYGKGSKTSDSIPARLSNGEFVMQAKAVDKFGVGFMSMVNQGKMPHDGAGFTGFRGGGGININMPGYATGGSVGVPSADALNKIIGDGDNVGVKKMTDFIMDNYVMPLIDSGTGGSAMKDVQRAGMQHIRSNVEAFVKDNFGGAGSAAAGLRWAKTQHGKPYQWGGNGNPSWDCSGFMSAIESVIRGEKPHRRWSTHAFNGGTPPGWKAGANRPFKVGITHAGVGHTAGTVGKTNVESAGGSAGVRVGSSARGYNNGMFTSWYGYTGPNATKAATGGLIRGKGSGTSDSIPAWLSNGEYVIRAAAAKKLGTGYLNALNNGAMVRFGAGGSVTNTSSGTQYKIVSGDTLSEIAAKFGTTVSALMKLNSTIKNANKIYAGQTIWLKKAAGGGTTPGGGGSAPGGGGFTLPGMSKVGKSGIQSSDGISALKGIVTLSQASIDANKAGANIKTEIVSALTKNETSGELMSNIYELQGQIKAAFKGKAETDMLSRLSTVTKALLPLQKNLEGVSKKLESAQGALEDLKGKFDSMKESVAENIMEFGQITKIGKWGTNPQTLLNQLQTDVGKATQFGDMLNQLKAKGINSDVIGQIAEAGITGGGMATAASLLNMTPEQIAKLNELQAELAKQANRAGESAAKGMYDAGIKAAEGLVKGLEAQQSAIEAQMMAIAKAMEKAIKQALGIKSPSKVMARLADYTADGWLQRLSARQPEAQAVMTDFVTPAVGIGPTVPAGTIGGGSAGTTITIENLNVCVDGTFPLNSAQDRKNLAKALAKDIKEAIRLDDKKYK